MPTHARPLRPEDGPLARFALELQKLRDSADPPRSVSKIARPDGFFPEGDPRNDLPARPTIYACLAGKRLPSEHTLRAMVLAWSASGSADLPYWMSRRRSIANELALDKERRPPPNDMIAQLIPRTDGVRRIVDYSEEAAEFHRQLRSLFDATGKNHIDAALCDPEPLYVVLAGYRLPAEGVLKELLRIAQADPGKASVLRNLWKRALDDLGSFAAMASLVTGSGASIRHRGLN